MAPLFTSLNLTYILFYTPLMTDDPDNNRLRQSLFSVRDSWLSAACLRHATHKNVSISKTTQNKRLWHHQFNTIQTFPYIMNHSIQQCFLQPIPRHSHTSRTEPKKKKKKRGANTNIMFSETKRLSENLTFACANVHDIAMPEIRAKRREKPITIPCSKHIRICSSQPNTQQPQYSTK